MHRHRQDFIALILLCAGVTALFLPAMLGRWGIFHDDQAMAEFPWHYFLAVHFQMGEIPLWEPNTWCGAIPFYARYYMDTYYFPLWPLYLLTRLGDLNQAYWTLSLIPLFLHYLLAGLGMYRFARRSIRLHPYPALLASWVYVFSPAFAYSYVWFPIVVVQAWLPWLLFSVVEMDRRPGFPRVASAAIFLALMSLCAQPPHLGYSVAVSFILAFGLALRRFLRGEFSMLLRAPLQLLLSLALGFLLSAVFWFSTLDGLRYTEQHLALTYRDVAGGDGSMPPLYLSSLFVPDLFGTVDGRHVWGFDITREIRYWEANTVGGLLVGFLVLSGFIFWRRRSPSRRLRFWAFAGAGVWLFALLCMLGRHTPFYRLIYDHVPMLSQFPFPIRYRMLQCLSAAWLAGLGAEALLQRHRASRPWPSRQVWGYLGLAAVGVGLALLWPQDLTLKHPGMLTALTRPWAFPGVMELAARRESDWFWLNPFSYYLAAVVLLILVWRGLRGRARCVAALALVMVETAFFALNAFYFCTFERRFFRPEHFRARRPGDQPLVARVLGPLAARRSDPWLRWATDQPFHDNFSRLEGSWALMGYDMKPLEKRFKRAIGVAFDRPMDWPIYWYYPRATFMRFLNHFSVGSLMDSNPDSPFALGKTARLELSPPLFLHINPWALPRLYAMDRIIECSAEEQLDQLVRGDLRAGAFMTEAPAGKDRTAEPKVVSYREFIEWSGQTLPPAASAGYEFSAPFRQEMRDHFNALKEQNRIRRIDFSRANSITTEVEIGTPSLLTFSETWYPGWEATVDDYPAEVYRVNYCQRGVWLEAGRHTVVLSFKPRAWKLGAFVSLASWILVPLMMFFKRRRKL